MCGNLFWVYYHALIRKYYSSQSKSRYGQAKSANTQCVTKEIGELREKVRDYRLHHVYNTDETGLFYKLLP